MGYSEPFPIPQVSASTLKSSASDEAMCPTILRWSGLRGVENRGWLEVLLAIY